MRIARVAVEKAAPSFDKGFDYRIPDPLTPAVGCRVLVPFGAGNQPRIGLVLSVSEEVGSDRLKLLLSVLDRQPLLTDEGQQLLKVLHDSSFCTWFDAFRTLIPPGAGMRVETGLLAAVETPPDDLSPDQARLLAYLIERKKLVPIPTALAAVGLKSTSLAAEALLARGLVTENRLVKKKIVDDRAVMARLSEAEPAPRYTPKQKAVATLLEQVGCASVRELCYFTGTTRAVIDRMKQQGKLELFEQITPRRVAAKNIAPTAVAPIVLSPAQQCAFDTLSEIGRRGTAETSLLYGVTGSGKTLVFLRLIEEVLAAGRQALVLIPEISLTPQTVETFVSRFGGRVAVLHSALSMTERLDEWQRIREGKADIVVGTRSAIFAPLSNIGLLVIDEEQEHTYHSERAPRYHARDIAKFRAKVHRAQLLLCSATPSVESYYAAKQGRYHLVPLTTRYSGNPLPGVHTIDMQEAPLAAGSGTISEELAELLRQTLERGEQAILLLNRRGYHTSLKCSSCGEIASCPHCSIPLTYHSANGRLLCHYCGYSHSEFDACTHCGSKLLRYTGAGTQRIEEELELLFPDARILRMDMDTTMSRFAHEKGFTAFADGQYDIMVGTQMVAKGLNFPNVTLVGVLTADQSLYTEDFRAFERTFSLLTQVIGRCGRAEKPGQAVIQTFSPEHRILALAAAQDYDAFFADELRYRKVGLYPPFCDIAALVFSDPNEQTAVESAKAYRAAFVRMAQEQYADLPIRVLGPTEDSPYRVAGKYRVRILLKCRLNQRQRDFFRQMFTWYYTQKKSAALSLDFYYE